MCKVLGCQSTKVTTEELQLELGLGAGTVVVSFASSIGATLAFIPARFLLRESVQGKFGKKLNIINAGVRKDGAFYLFTMKKFQVLENLWARVVGVIAIEFQV